jgi:phosphatidate phosphatase APP1
MTVYLVVFVVLLLFASTITSQNLQHEHRIHRLWQTVTDKLIDKYNIDTRHFDKEEILLFPDVGFQSLNDSNTWIITVHGWIYQNNKRKDWLGFSAGRWIERLGRNLANQNDILYLNGSINRDRLRPFFATDRSNEAIVIKIGDTTHSFLTDEYGEFYEQIQVTNDDIQISKQQKGDVVTYKAIREDEGNSTGIIRLIEPSHGISIISDIDDTIKISEVLDKVRLLANTFISPFRPVVGKYKNTKNKSFEISFRFLGMPDLYQQWQAKNKNCIFHYLSGMPDQLYTLTQEFININHFPDGSFHMRHFGWAAASLFNFLHSRSTFTHKMSYLHFFLSNTNRDYVLIGDSGEKDPEIYGTITREYPERVRAIFIRAIKGESFDDQRFIDAFEGISQEKWLIFNDPKQVPLDLSRAPRAIAR